MGSYGATLIRWTVIRQTNNVDSLQPPVSLESKSTLYFSGPFPLCLGECLRVLVGLPKKKKKKKVRQAIDFSLRLKKLKKLTSQTPN